MKKALAKKESDVRGHFSFYLFNSLKVDPNRVKKKETLRKNMKELLKLCKTFMAAIISSKDSIPKYVITSYEPFPTVYLAKFEIYCTTRQEKLNWSFQLIQTCVLLYFCTSAYWPLRLLVLMHTAFVMVIIQFNWTKVFSFYLFADAPKPETTRLLVNVSKILQRLSTGTEFTEEHMEDCNYFINEYKSSWTSFLDQVTVS